MHDTDDELKRVRSAALQSAESILLARQRAEEALHRQSEWLRITLASIGDAVISTDAEGRVTFMNGVAESLTGWPHAEALGRPLPDVFHIINEYTRLPAENPALQALEEGTIVGLANHTVLVARDGTERPIDDSAAPMRDGNKPPIGAVLVFRDVSERKRTEETRALLAAIVESSDDANISKSLDGTIRSWNSGAERLFGYSRTEAIGRPITLIMPPDRIDEERAILARLCRGERIDHYETIRLSKEGRRLDISLTISPIRDAEGRIVGASKIARDITARKQAEKERLLLLEEMQAERERLAELFQLSPAFTAVVRGPDHVFERVNDRYYDLIGHRDVIGRPAREAVPEVEGQGYFEVLDRVFQTGTPFVGSDMRILLRRHPDGPLEERSIDIVYQPLRTPEGEISGILAIGTDLTDRKRAEAAVRERDERLQLFLGNATDYAVVITDLEGRVLEWLGGAQKITGWQAAEVLGKPLGLLFTADDRAAGLPEAELSRAAQTGRVEDKRWHQRKDGSHFFGDGVTVGLRGQAGELHGFGKVFRDATEQKRAQEVMARNALLLAGVRDSVVVTDLDGIVTYWNEGATRLFGWTAEEMMGRHYADRFPEPAWTFIAGAICEPANGSEWSGEYEDYRKDGSRVWIDARVGPVADAEGRVIGILGVAHDITDRKRAEEALREADRRKDEFLAILAHELRNPLAPIRNGPQVVRLAGSDAAAVAQARDMMERQLGHMVRLIDDLLDVSRISRNKMELRRARVQLADVVRSAVETARPLIEAAGHQLTVSIPPEPVLLDADLTRLAQVAGNLLTNSAKYTPRGGRIELTAERQGNEVVITVRDSGIGIPAESLPTLFDMFSQVDRSIERTTGGLGIGLALVKGLVEMHGGTVTVASDGPGKGSTFTVRLPVLATVPQPTDTARPEHERRAPGPKRRVLVLDDNRDSARSMAKVLMLLGNEVRTAHDGIEAVEEAERFRPEIVLMDVGMPRLNGYEATRRIREQPWGKAAAIIALTGWGQEGDRTRSREAGCDGHLVKPVNLPDLEKLVNELARGTAPKGAAQET
ncbi:MAG: PAS domain S-box protein [Isosphaeraceae bacterium]|nr:PAS domain S-box protein [Isosphaeraceae bacterium]